MATAMNLRELRVKTAMVVNGGDNRRLQAGELLAARRRPVPLRGGGRSGNRRLMAMHPRMAKTSSSRNTSTKPMPRTSGRSLRLTGRHCQS